MTWPAEGPGTPLREMATQDRIRLTGLLRKTPAHVGVFYVWPTQRVHDVPRLVATVFVRDERVALADGSIRTGETWLAS